MLWFFWLFIGLVVLYVLKVLYDVNFRKEELKPQSPYKLHESFIKASTKEDFLAIPVQIPDPVDARESLTQALSYDLAEQSSDKAYVPLQKRRKPLTVKEVIPESKGIDLDCFIYFKGARILVIEDNPINQKIVEKILMSSGMEIDFASNGEEGLSLLFSRRVDYDLVLMDISMPVMNGITATKIIRRTTAFDHLPIITFTAFGVGNEIEAMFKAGANAYITKPINIDQLYTVFQLYIGNVNRGLSVDKMFQLQGLDISKGKAEALERGEPYQEVLERFLMQYQSSATLMPEWIVRKRYDRVRLELKQLLPRLDEIGAYEMYDLVQEMQMQFLYLNAHLLDKFSLRYRIGMQTLIETIDAYLESQKEQQKKSDKV